MVRKARGGDDVGTLTLLDLQLRVGVSPWSLYGLPPHSLLAVSSSRCWSPTRWTLWSPSLMIVRELNTVVRFISVILIALALPALAGGAAS